jgi:hypothetical protein
MRLSEAIRLGSLAIQNPTAGDTRSCAMGMALKAVGKLHLEPLMAQLDGTYTVAENFGEFSKQWPWVDTWHVYEGNDETYTSRVYGLFDHQVCGGLMTIEALCDQVAIWESELESRGVNVEQISAPRASVSPITDMVSA